MTEKIKILYYALWLAHPVLQTVIAIAMLRRGQHREFKYFFAYIVAQILTFAAVFPTYLYHDSILFYVSWFSTAVSVASLSVDLSRVAVSHSENSAAWAGCLLCAKTG